MAYIKIDDEGRITAASRTHHCGEGEIEVEIPEEIDMEVIHEYRYRDGAFFYDPKPPVPGDDKPTYDERIATLEEENRHLKETLEIILSGAIEDGNESVEETSV